MKRLIIIFIFCSGIFLSAMYYQKVANDSIIEYLESKAAKNECYRIQQEQRKLIPDLPLFPVNISVVDSPDQESHEENSS